jgi:hypothetical protein
MLVHQVVHAVGLFMHSCKCVKVIGLLCGTLLAATSDISHGSGAQLCAPLRACHTWSVVQAFESTVRQLEQSRGPCEDLLVALVCDTARSALLHVRSIAATYRMAARPAPTKPSHYVASLLKSTEVRLSTRRCRRLVKVCERSLQTIDLKSHGNSWPWSPVMILAQEMHVCMCHAHGCFR